MGFFQPPLLNRAMQPNGNANNTTSITATTVNDSPKAVCNTIFTVENVNSRNMPFSQNPTCHPLVPNSTLMMKMFRTPTIMG